jgi:hypothetical protein
MRRPGADLEEKHEPPGTLSANAEPNAKEKRNEVRLLLTNAAIEKLPFPFRPQRAHHGHPAEPGERSEPDIQASAPSDGDGWNAASPPSGIDAATPDIRLTAKVGRKRNSRSGERAGNNRTPPHGDCQRHSSAHCRPSAKHAPLSAIKTAASSSARHASAKSRSGSSSLPRRNSFCASSSVLLGSSA